MRSSQQTGERTDIDGAGNPLSPNPATIPAPYRFVGPITTKSDFERFAEDGTGRRLPVYGRRLFDEVPTTFAPVERVPVPADYVIGPGDELLIRAWGKIDLDSRVTVDRNGQVYLPRVGTLNVAGLRYEQLEGYLHAAISALFKDFELNVALGQLRSIQIFVLGSARQPGAYTVGSLSTRPFPLAYTRVFAVPRSMARSRDIGPHGTAGGAPDRISAFSVSSLNA